MPLPSTVGASGCRRSESHRYGRLVSISFFGTSLNCLEDITCIHVLSRMIHFKVVEYRSNFALISSLRNAITALDTVVTSLNALVTSMTKTETRLRAFPPSTDFSQQFRSTAKFTLPKILLVSLLG